MTEPEITLTATASDGQQEPVASKTNITGGGAIVLSPMGRLLLSNDRYMELEGYEVLLHRYHEILEQFRFDTEAPIDTLHRIIMDYHNVCQEKTDMEFKMSRHVDNLEIKPDCQTTHANVPDVVLIDRALFNQFMADRDELKLAKARIAELEFHERRRGHETS